MLDSIEKYITNFREKSLPENRRNILDHIVKYVEDTFEPKLHFICTHNSRRSQWAQVWAHTFSHYFQVGVGVFSGGTEVSAFHPQALNALGRAGFEIHGRGSENPRYEIAFSDSEDPIICFSKRIEEALPPPPSFAAIMTCAQADQSCPCVVGANKQIRLFYEDPRVADHTPQEIATYDKRCKEIAMEMYYVFRSVRTKAK